MVAMVAIVAVVGLSAEPASAHASLVHSDPQPNAVLEVPPTELRLEFSEPVNGNLSDVELTIGTEVLAATTTQSAPDDPSALIVTMPPEVDDGVVIARWRALSSADGHVTEGVLVFGIGEADPTTATFEVPTVGINPFDAVSRWLNLTSIVVLLGALFAPFLLAEEGLRRRALRFSLIVGAISIGVTLLAVVVQLHTVLSVVDDLGVGSAIGQLVFASRWGLLWWTRLVVITALTLHARSRHAGSLQAGSRHAGSMYGVGLGAVLVGAQVAGSHSAGLGSWRWLAMAAEALHLGAASIWAGGLVALAFATYPLLRAGDREPLGRLYRRFTTPAAVASATLIGTGLVLTGRHATSLDAVLRTTWGRWLVVKLAAMGAMLALGAMNSLAFRHRAAGGWNTGFWATGFWNTLADRMARIGGSLRSISLEVGGVAVVLLAAGLVTAAPTANGPEFTPAAELGSDTQSGQSGDVLVGLTVNPNRPGQNLLSVLAASTLRPAPGEIRRILVRADYNDDDRAMKTLELEGVSDNRWELLDPVLSSPGSWTIEVVARRADLPDQVVTFDWNLPAVEPHDPIISDSRWGGRLGLLGLLIVAGGVAGLVVAARVTRSSQEEQAAPEEPVGSRR